jgi:hypothetical protein
MLINEFQYPANERLSPEVAEFAESSAATKMFRSIGVAAGAAERTFARNLDRQQGGIPAQDASPARKDFLGGEAWIWGGTLHRLI